MGTIRIRFIMVALVVSFFAVGMAAFLNYFKYKSTIGDIVKSRVLVIGRNIENSVQASLSVGMQFTELGTLTELLKREQESDRADPRHRRLRPHRPGHLQHRPGARGREGARDAGLRAAERSKTTEWTPRKVDEYVAGISLKNNFDLTVGYLALRYSARRGRERRQGRAARSCSPRPSPSWASPSSRRSR